MICSHAGTIETPLKRRFPIKWPSESSEFLAKRDDAMLTMQCFHHQFLVRTPNWETYRFWKIKYFPLGQNLIHTQSGILWFSWFCWNQIRFSEPLNNERLSRGFLSNDSFGSSSIAFTFAGFIRSQIGGFGSNEFRCDRCWLLWAPMAFDRLWTKRIRVQSEFRLSSSSESEMLQTLFKALPNLEFRCADSALPFWLPITPTIHAIWIVERVQPKFL